MKKINLEVEYEKYKPMMISVAITFHKKAGMELEDTVSEFDMIFCKVANNFTKEKGATFGTFLYKCLYNHGKHLVDAHMSKINKNLFIRPPNEIIVRVVAGNPEDTCIFKDNLFNNKDEVVRSIGGILSTYKLPKGKKAPGVRGWVEKILQSFGFKQYEIMEGFKEFKKIY